MQKKRNLMGLILFFMTLGSGLYSLFVPIYYMNNGVSFTAIKFFMIAYMFGGIIGGFFANHIIHKIGIKAFILIRGIIEPLVVILIRLYPVFRYPIYIQGLISGFIGFSYWISLDTITMLITDKEKRGSQQGALYGLMWCATIFSPFLGGALIKYTSYPVLFVVAFALVLGGGILSFKLDVKTKIKKKYNLIPTLKGKIGTHIILMIFRGFNFPLTGFIFSLMIYWVENDEFIVGIFGFAMGIAALVSSFLAGKLVDKYNPVNVYIWITVLTGLSWLIFLFDVSIYIPILLVYFFYYSGIIPSNTIFFNDAKNWDIVTLTTERMMSFCFAGLILVILYLFLPLNIIYILLASSMFISTYFIKKLET